MQSIVDELYESWLNGNLSYVIERVTTWRGAKAVIGGALLYSAMSGSDRMVFLRMLTREMNEE